MSCGVGDGDGRESSTGVGANFGGALGGISDFNDRPPNSSFEESTGEVQRVSNLSQMAYVFCIPSSTTHARLRAHLA